MRKKRVMIVGPAKSGKTTLADLFNDTKTPSKRTPNLVYKEHTIDVPAGYLECPWMHCHIISTAQDAFCVLMLLESGCRKEMYPPGFAKAFRVPVIGVITKSEKEWEREPHCVKQFLRAGIQEPFYTVSLQEDVSFLLLKQTVWQEKRGWR